MTVRDVDHRECVRMECTECGGIEAKPRSETNCYFCGGRDTCEPVSEEGE